MEEINVGFNISNTTETINNELEVTFTPDTSIRKYEYRLIIDGKPSDYIAVDDSSETTIFLDESGSFQIEVNAFDRYNSITEYKSGTYSLDLDKPIISFKRKDIELKAGSSFDAKSVVVAKDRQEGDISSRVKINEKSFDTNNPGVYNISYSVSDSAGNKAEEYLTVNVVGSDFAGLMSLQLALLAILCIIVVSVFKYKKKLELYSRVGKYGIEPIDTSEKSLFDGVIKGYISIVFFLRRFMIKSVYFKKASLRYKKYINTADSLLKDEVDFITNKFIFGIAFSLIAIFTEALRYELMSFYELVLPFFFGYFLPDLIYITKYKMYRSKIENDLLQAIIIMNNAFKSGRSITQAILLVGNEMEGPIADEFKKMHMEVSLGLSIEVVFKRFSDRINLDEVSYLTASLTILNKAGGNIINVFTSIEKSLFNKKKLKLELKSLTGSSKIIFYALLIVPVAFGLMISVVNPGYFKPLYTTTIGAIITGIMIIIYVVYFFAARALMKVRM